MAKIKPPHSGHNKHLCYLVNMGMQQRAQADYAKLVRDAQYMCKICGRVAAKPRNLCKPVKI
ncbi:MAG: hypothetical protein WCZ89_04540 [Phycisphaerae bacterium]